MGLNWSEGLKAAGEGVGQMAGMKMQEADWAYKEMAQQNRQRFQEQEADKQRDFLSGETDRKFQHDVDMEAERVKREELRHEERMDAEDRRWKQFEMTFGQTERRIGNEEARIENQAAAQRAENMEDLRKVDQSTLDSARKERDRVTGNFMEMDEGVKQDAKNQYAAIEDMLKIMPKGGDLDRMYDERSAYQNAWDFMSGQGGLSPDDAAEARKIARSYSEVSPNGRMKILERRNQLAGEGQSPQEAFVNALNEHNMKAGKKKTSASEFIPKDTSETAGQDDAPPPAPKMDKEAQVAKQSVGNRPRPDVSAKEDELEEKAVEIAKAKGWIRNQGRGIRSIKPAKKAEALALAKKELETPPEQVPQQYVGVGSGLPTGGAIGGASP